jgi:hypothetical protein
MNSKSLFVNTSNTLLSNQTSKSILTYDSNTNVVNNNTAYTVFNSSLSNPSGIKSTISTMSNTSNVTSSVLLGAEFMNSRSIMNFKNLLNNESFKKIQNILNYYSLGNFQYIIDHLDIDDFNDLSVALYELMDETDTYYEPIRNFITNTLKALYQSVLQTIRIQEFMVENTSLKDENSILHNKEKLIAYLENLKYSLSNLFNDFKISVTAVKIKPEYQIYIEKYGFPKNAVFEPDLLAPILEYLELQKLLV